MPRIPVVGSDDPRVWCDPVNGLITNDGLSQASPVKELQHAIDIAAYGHELIPPYIWTPSSGHDEGLYLGVKVRLMNSPAGACVITNPLYLDGNGACGPITLEGDIAQHPTATHIRANNTFQGATSQNGGRLYLKHLAMDGKGNCTLVNGTRQGIIGIKENVWLGPAFDGGVSAPTGAAGGSSLVLHAVVTLWGSKHNAIMTGIENSQIFITTTGGFHLNNVMEYTQVLGLQGGKCWTQGSPPIFTGEWAASVALGATRTPKTCLKFSVTDLSYSSIFDALNNIPGNGYTLGTASHAYDHTGAKLPSNNPYVL